MSRRVASTQLHAAAAPSIDGYFDRVLKYIPGEVVAGWVTITGIIASVSSGDNAVLLWVLFGVFMLLTAAYTWKLTNIAGQPPAVKQIVIATIAFIIWAFALGGPFATIEGYTALWGSATLIVYTLAMGIVV